jgi:hypothetical protein
VQNEKLQVLEDAIEFFKDFYRVKLYDVKYLFVPESNPVANGTYNRESQLVIVYGIDHNPIDSLLNTLFHELWHHYQYYIARTLKAESKVFITSSESLCQSVPWDEPRIRDIYHYPYKVMYRTFFYSKDETDVKYWDKEYELEARDKASMLHKV